MIHTRSQKYLLLGYLSFQLLSTNEYYSSTGTSDATVFVTGILALILEAEPNLISPSSDCLSQVKTALMNSAVPLQDGTEHDSRWGYGAIDGKSWLDEIQSTVAC